MENSLPAFNKAKHSISIHRFWSFQSVPRAHEFIHVLSASWSKTLSTFSNQIFFHLVRGRNWAFAPFLFRSSFCRFDNERVTFINASIRRTFIQSYFSTSDSFLSFPASFVESLSCLNEHQVSFFTSSASALRDGRPPWVWRKWFFNESRRKWGGSKEKRRICVMNFFEGKIMGSLPWLARAAAQGGRAKREKLQIKKFSNSWA